MGLGSTIKTERIAPPQLWTERNWRPAFWICALVGGGGLQAWTLRHFIELDGISYLDIAWGYAHGDWHQAINAYWSPLFSWVLAVVLRLSHAGRRHELIALHAMNFGFFVASIAAFDFLRREIRSRRKNNGGRATQFALGSGAFALIAYSVFLYGSRYMLGAWLDQPDILVAAIVFLDTALLVRIAGGDRRFRTFVAFGVLLGLGYLTKTFLFPLGVVFLVCAFFAAQPVRRAAAHLAVASLLFAAIAGSWIAVISRAEKRFTFGTVGGIAYFIYSHGLQSGDIWFGGATQGFPIHAVARVMDSPEVLLFPAPKGTGETFPPMFDPGYYLAGAENQLTLHGEIEISRQTLPAIGRLLSQEKVLLAGILILMLLTGVRTFVRETLKLWPVWVPSALALTAYATVQIEARLVEPFIVIVWVALFAAVCLPAADSAARVSSYVVGVIALFLCLPVAQAIVGDAQVLRSPVERHNLDLGAQWQVAEGLHNDGLAPGDRVAIIGNDFHNMEYWAQLDELTIVGEVPESDTTSFWSMAPDARNKILDIFASAGAKAALTYRIPAGVPRAGWQTIGGTPHSLYMFHNGMTVH